MSSLSLLLANLSITSAKKFTALIRFCSPPGECGVRNSSGLLASTGLHPGCSSMLLHTILPCSFRSPPRKTGFGEAKNPELAAWLHTRKPSQHIKK